MTQEKIREKIHEQLPLLKVKYHVKKIGIFGSFVRGEQKKGSDLDILVLTKKFYGKQSRMTC